MSRRLAQTVSGAVSLAMVTGMLFGCTNGTTSPGDAAPTVDTTLDNTDQADPASALAEPEKTIRIGIKFDQPGLGLMEVDGPSGFEVDVAAYVAWKLGHSPYDIDWVEAITSERENMLINQDVDMIFATYSWSEDRAEKVDFAGPYLVSGQDILVRADDNSINNIEDLVGKRICSVSGSVSFRQIKEILGDAARYTEVDRHSDCMALLLADEVDAFTADNTILAGLMTIDEFWGHVRLLGHPFSQEQIVVGLPPDSPELCQAVNDALTDMVEDGSWEKFVLRYTDEPDLLLDPAQNPPTTFLPCS